MASLIGKPVGKVAQEVADLEQGRVFQSPLNKAWRALILLNRTTSPMAKSGVRETNTEAKKADAINSHYAREKSFSVAQSQDPWSNNKVVARTSGVSAEELVKSKAIDYTMANQLVSDIIKNDIVIANLNGTPPVSLVIQNRPNSIRVEPTATWAAVKSMGRNNPFYFYTGGEDTITFDISWYSVDTEHRDDVVNKCRLLESWTRADGYSASPPTLRIQWGNSGLFEDDLFILASAQYELTHFQNAARMRRRYDNDPDTGQRITSTVSQPFNLKLLPNYATQTLTFKRVTKNNRTWEEIIPNEKLIRTPGIIMDDTDRDFIQDMDEVYSQGLNDLSL